MSVRFPRRVLLPTAQNTRPQRKVDSSETTREYSGLPIDVDDPEVLPVLHPRTTPHAFQRMTRDVVLSQLRARNNMLHLLIGSLGVELLPSEGAHVAAPALRSQKLWQDIQVRSAFPRIPAPR